jgi:hypothetical protein
MRNQHDAVGVAMPINEAIDNVPSEMIWLL